MKKITTLLLLLLLLTSCKNREKDLDKFLLKQNFSGTILVKEGEKILYKKAMGYSNFENQLKNQIDTKFLVGSVSKPLTTIAFLNLLIEKDISVNDTIDKYINFPHGEKIRIKDLLMQSSGFDRYIDIKLINGKMEIIVPQGLEFGMNFVDSNHLLSYLEGTAFHQDKEFRYSNLNFILVSKVLENISGQSYKDYVNDYYKNIGLLDTGITYNYWEDLESRSFSYSDKNYSIKGDRDNLSKLLGAGGMYSTVSDLTKLFELIKNKKILNEHFITEIFEAKAKISKEQYWLGDFYSYGFVVEENKNKISHPGSLFFFESSIYYDKEKDLSIVILNNTNNRNIQRIKERILYYFD